MSRNGVKRGKVQGGSAAGVAALAWGRVGRAAGPAGEARVYIDPARSRVDIDRRLFGSFLEHLGRAIYQGVFEPGSKLADAQGFRKDVLEEVRALGVPIVRYPGGNFVSGYNWLDGVGPAKDRPRVLDRAWNSLETNQFGTNEFLAWCQAVKTEPLLAVNLGTGTPETAAALVEYCNGAKGTRWSELRHTHGVAEPYRVKRWCLGNEMDGPWQIGHLTASEYGRKAADAARQMRMVDPSLELIACGSSSPGMATFLEWDRVVLEQCYNEVNALSLHRYFNNQGDTGGDSGRYLALNLSMEDQIRDVAATCDYVRRRLKSRKRLWLSFDEWNVWYRATNGDGKRQEAPHLLEEVYNLEDALLVGGLVNSLLRHADRVRVACLAQLVNVIAPLMTGPEGVVRQTIYYPYAWALAHARGRLLDLGVESPTYEVRDRGAVPYVDVAGTWDGAGGRASVFVLNRDLERPRTVTLLWRDQAPAKVLDGQVLTGKDLKAANTFGEPRKVVPQPLEVPAAGPKMVLQVPARSYSVVRFQVGGSAG